MNVFRVALKSDGPNQITALDDRVSRVVLVRISLKDRIGRKVKLRGERLVTGRTDQVMNVLAHAVRIMPRHHGIEGIVSGSIGYERGPVALAFYIVMTQVVTMPNFKHGIGHTAGVSGEDLSGNSQRQTRIAWYAQICAMRCPPLVERANFVPRCRLECWTFSVFLPGGNCIF